MGNLLEAIEACSQSEIKAGGMTWRVRKVCSADLARVGHAALAVAQGLSPDIINGAEDEEKAMSAVRQASVRQLETMANLKDAVVAAGLVAVGDEKGQNWENVRVTLKPEQGDASNGVVWVGALPTGVSETIFTEIMSLSTDGGAAVERLQTFRARARNASRTRSGSKKVRKAAP